MHHCPNCGLDLDRLPGAEADPYEDDASFLAEHGIEMPSLDEYEALKAAFMAEVPRIAEVSFGSGPIPTT